VNNEESINTRYRQILKRIEEVARESDRAEESIKLVVVTKGQELRKVQAVIDAGAQTLGENYPEEGVEKMERLSHTGQLKWHMIGHVQSRKAQLVCERYDWVQSLDRLKIAKRINRYSDQVGKTMPVLIEFNVSGEESKFGFDARIEKEWPSLSPIVEKILEIHHIEIRGLMTMPPYFDDPEKARPYFVKLHKLRDFLAYRYPQSSWRELSMGMSGDFEIAIQEGATIVRIGQAILGPRKS
jgi:pyridoxal phosphate enzyme (YggS family)